MNVIIAYLETMFSAHPQTPRLLEAKAELLAMMEDAYSASLADGLSENEAVGRVITDFGNLDDLADELGISNEIHPPTVTAPAAATSVAAAPARPAAPAHPPITREEAEGYADMRRATEPTLATAIALCVIAPAPLIALSSIGGTGSTPLTSEIATLLGLVTMFALVAIAVLMLVRRSQKSAPFVRITDGDFTRTPAIDRWARELAATHSARRSTRLQIAILLWILSVVPIFVVTLLPSTAQALGGAGVGVGVAAMLAMVALGLLIFLPSNWAAASATELIESGWNVGDPDNRTGDADDSGILGVISAIYWPLLTVIYLAWSFIWDAWSESWIVWPIGAVLYGALAAGIGAWESYRKVRSR